MNYQKATNSDVIADEKAMNEMEFINILKKFKKTELLRKKQKTKQKKLEKIVGSKNKNQSLL